MMKRRSGTVGILLALTACGAPRLDPATRAMLPHSVPPIVGEVLFSRGEATYVVSGLSLTDLRRAMRDHAIANWSDPQAAGMTTSILATELKCQEYSDGGALQTATVKLSLLVHLPDWQDASQAPVALQQSWESFSRALRAHEEGHVKIASDYARALRNALQSLPVEDSCPTLLGHAAAITRRAESRMARAQADYDAKTNHGGTQGCIL